MASDIVSATQTILWQPQPAAAAVVHDVFETFCERSADIRRFAGRLLERTGTRLIDWVDHFALPADPLLEARLRQCGFVASPDATQICWRHPDGLFPPIFLHASREARLAIRVESAADLSAAQAVVAEAIEGAPLGPFRKVRMSQGDVEWWAVERHGYQGWDLPEVPAAQIAAAVRHGEAFRRRRRQFPEAKAGFAHARELIRAAVGDLGPGWASDLFFFAERAYWTGRNRAARVQKARQDALGLGWANHDHHTYRSSREHFAKLIHLLEKLGLVCRERFYAGREAGWGAQVLEQPESQVVVFADVDLGADEVLGDFAHEGLAPQSNFGTVGLWCLLHGEAFLQPGMHHLECRFDFESAGRQLAQAGVPVMPPFTDLPWLKQAFTEGEMWPLEPARLQAALARRTITSEQAQRFAQQGAIGSHLEILQRDQGYKGFNQSGINAIIRITDPRRRVQDIER